MPDLGGENVADHLGDRGIIVGERNATRQQEAPLFAGQLALELQNTGAQQEGEEQFIPDKQGSADVAVEEIEEIFSQEFETFLHIIRLLTILNGLFEEIHVVGQRILIHRINIG